MAGKELPVVPPVTKRENRGGYDCEFVTPPPDAIQTECPVCLMIPKEPCVISCPCGMEFCRECIERIKKYNKPCPLCNLTDFTFMRHHGSERYLKAQEVWCSHKQDGCKWQGKLGKLENHLDEGNLSGCQFVALECTNSCGEWFQRRHITLHQTEQCMKRPYSCQYCHSFQSTFKDVSQNHYQKCSQNPIACPNKCRKDPFKQQELEGHLQDQCPLTKVNCPLHYAGCVVKLPRKDMPEHMKEAAIKHVTMLSSVTAYLLNENRALHATEYRCQELEEMLDGMTSWSEALEKKLQATEQNLQATQQMCHFLHAKQKDTEMRLNTVYPQKEP